MFGVNFAPGYPRRYPAKQISMSLKMMESTIADGKPDHDSREISVGHWRLTRAIAALVAVVAIFLSVAGTVTSMMSKFAELAQHESTVAVDELAMSIESSLKLGAWLSPVIIASVILWFVARTKLKRLGRLRPLSNHNAV